MSCRVSLVTSSKVASVNAVEVSDARRTKEVLSSRDVVPDQRLSISNLHHRYKDTVISKVDRKEHLTKGRV
jgi:hypothetical protein